MGHTAVAYVFEGSGLFEHGDQGSGEATAVSAVRLVQFEDGDQLRARAKPDAPFRFMLMAGAPFKEPIVPYGPFVMNTMAEIQQALIDLRNGTFVEA